MTKNYLKLCVFLIFVIPLAACETEQKNAQSSSSILSYNEDLAKKQAQLMNEEALKKTPIIGATAVIDGSTQKISNMTISNNTQ